MDITGTRGDIVTITGENLYFTPESAIYFNSISDKTKVIPRSGSFLNNSRFEFEVPSSLPKNNIIYYYNSAGSGLLSNVSFRFVSDPKITGVTPNSGYWRDSVYVSGEDFINVKSIYIGDSQAKEFEMISENLIRVLIPDGSSTNSISIEATGGSVNSSGVNEFIQIYEPAPSIQLIKPSSGFYGGNIVISGVGLHKVNDILLTGIDSIITERSFSVTDTTGISFSIPTGALSNNKIQIRQTKDSTTGGIFDASGFISSISSQNLKILNEYIIDFNPKNGIYGDLITVSGNRFSQGSFSFNGFNTGDRNYIPPLSVNVINDELAQITVSNNIIVGKINFSGLNLVSSKENFIPLPVITSFSGDKLRVGDPFILSGKNITQIYPALFLSGITSESHFIVANKNTENVFPIITEDSDPNEEQKYFGAFVVDTSELTADYPSSTLTGNAKITGLINSAYFGEGKAFLLSDKELNSSPTQISSKDYINLLSNFNFSFPLGKDRMSEISQIIEISGKRPSVSGVSVERIGETGGLLISGKYFFGITGVKLTDGVFEGVIPVSELVPFSNDLNILTIRTGLEPNAYEKMHVISVNIQDFNYAGKTGSFQLAAPYFEWV